jgi:hypothetical protein
VSDIVRKYEVYKRDKPNKSRNYCVSNNVEKKEANSEGWAQHIALTVPRFEGQKLMNKLRKQPSIDTLDT